MTEPHKATDSNPQVDDEVLRRRLLKRLAVAGGLVVALVGALVMFDALYVRTEPEPSPRVAAVGTVTPERKEPEVPVEEKAVEPADAEAAKDKPAEAPAEPELTTAPSVLPPVARPERPLTVPATARPAMMRPVEPIAAAKPAAEPVPPRSAAPRAAAMPGSTMSSTKSVPPLAAVSESVKRFLVQIGVFTNPANAEELRAKLELAGLPTRIETHVQVGPFASRQEVDQAREKLKAMGLDPGVLIAAKK